MRFSGARGFVSHRSCSSFLRNQVANGPLGRREVFGRLAVSTASASSVSPWMLGRQSVGGRHAVQAAIELDQTQRPRPTLHHWTGRVRMERQDMGDRRVSRSVLVVEEVAARARRSPARTPVKPVTDSVCATALSPETHRASAALSPLQVGRQLHRDIRIATVGRRPRTSESLALGGSCSAVSRALSAARLMRWSRG